MTRPSAEIQKELDQKKSRSDELMQLIGRMEDDLQNLKKERDTLTGGAWGRPCDGKIAYLQGELKVALREEHDETALRIQWVSGKSPDLSRGRVYVLDKVTAKQISVRISGVRHTDKYNLDGTSFARGRVEEIDIRKTFNIDADEVPPNWKGTK